jgi:hypothetical protein
MELWEGAVLLVGGIWLVGRMHRIQVQSYPPSMAVGLPSAQVPGPTSMTNTDGSGFLVLGESLYTGTGPQPIRGGSCPSCNSGLPIASKPGSGGATLASNLRQPLAQPIVRRSSMIQM